VTVLERARVGEEAASTAAAGMLGAQLEAHPVERMQALCVASRQRFPDFVANITELGACDVELRITGALRIAYDLPALAALGEDVAVQRSRDLEAELITAADVQQMEPALAPVAGAALFRGDGIVEPRELLRATLAAAISAGARFEESCEARALAIDARGEVDGVVHERGRAKADVVVLAAGSWSSRIEGVDKAGLHLPLVEPVRGQMIEIACQEQPLRHIVEGPVAYLSPRADGRVLVGSTVEHVGFERAVTLGAVARLAAEAVRMVPSLESAELRRTWCGFRAATPDGLPIFDRIGGLVVATGHYRNGVVLAPITADIVVALALGEATPCDISIFSIDRFKQEEVTHGHVS
jgi:glycine oxidase